MKNSVKIISVALASLSVFAVAGCSTKTKTVTPTASNWYQVTTRSGIDPSIINGQHEKLVYDVSLVKNSGANSTYRAEIESGTYVTDFYATTYDWSEHELEAYRTDGTEPVYVLETEFALKGRYVLTSTEEYVEFNDSATTVCYFRSAGSNLQPIYSYQKVYSTTPAYLNGISKETLTVNATYENKAFYNKDCSEATAYYTDLNAKESQPTESVIKGLNETGYSLFDTSNVYFAMRAMDTNSSDFSKTVSVCIPVEKKYKNYVITSSGETVLAEEETKIKSALFNAGYCVADEEIKYNAVTATLSASMTGGSHTAWFASVPDVSGNWCRSTMLKLKVPLSFNLGTLEYVLNTVESSFQV